MKTGTINFYSSDISTVVFDAILDALIHEGWSANKSEQIVFALNDDYDLTSLPYNDINFQIVKGKIRDRINNSLNVALDLVFRNTGIIIGLNFIDNETIMVSIPENIKYLDHVQIIDFSWYFNHLKPIISTLNCYRISCVFD